MEAATVLHRIGACAALLLLGVPTAQRADAQASDAVKYFQYNIENVTVAPDVVAPGSYKVRVMFSVTDPTNGGPRGTSRPRPPSSSPRRRRQRRSVPPHARHRLGLLVRLHQYRQRRPGAERRPVVPPPAPPPRWSRRSPTSTRPGRDHARRTHARRRERHQSVLGREDRDPRAVRQRRGHLRPRRDRGSPGVQRARRVRGHAERDRSRDERDRRLRVPAREPAGGDRSESAPTGRRHREVQGMPRRQAARRHGRADAVAARRQPQPEPESVRDVPQRQPDRRPVPVPRRRSGDLRSRDGRRLQDDGALDPLGRVPRDAVRGHRPQQLDQRLQRRPLPVDAAQLP